MNTSRIVELANNSSSLTPSEQQEFLHVVKEFLHQCDEYEQQGLLGDFENQLLEQGMKPEVLKNLMEERKQAALVPGKTVPDEEKPVVIPKKDSTLKRVFGSLFNLFVCAVACFLIHLVLTFLFIVIPIAFHGIVLPGAVVSALTAVLVAIMTLLVARSAAKSRSDEINMSIACIALAVLIAAFSFIAIDEGAGTLVYGGFYLLSTVLTYLLLEISKLRGRTTKEESNPG